MKKTLFMGFAALCLSASLMAQEANDNALRINFTGTGNPIETEHSLVGTQITFSDDGRSMNLSTNGATATYSLVDHVSGMTTFSGTPSVSLHANEDPTDGQEGKYYTTFYSGLEAYALPEGVKAYTAEVDGDVINLTSIEGDILPQGEAVLLYSNELQDGNFTMEIADPTSATKSTSNQFCGVDVQTTQEDYGTYNFYMLSYGQKGLGFYKMGDSMMLSANKAFIVQSPAELARALRMIFAEEEEMSIESIGDDSESSPSEIYSLSGVRQTKLQQGINIVNGKKIVVK